MNFSLGYPQFHFGYLREYSVMMSADDAYYAKMFAENDQFRHWMPFAYRSTYSSTSTAPLRLYSNTSPRLFSSTPPAHRNFYSSVGNSCTSSFSQNRYSSATEKQDQAIVIMRENKIIEHNKSKSSFVQLSNAGYRNRQIVLKNSFNKQPQPVFFNGQNGQPIFFNGQSSQSAPKPKIISDEKITYSSSLVADSPRKHPLTDQTLNNNTHVAFPNTNAGRSTVFKPCGFCRQNDEKPKYYESHPLKDEYGNVVCPILRAYVCKICGASGSRAHTITYCPVLKANCDKPMKSVVSLKNTLRNSAGEIRKQYRKKESGAYSTEIRK